MAEPIQEPAQAANSTTEIQEFLKDPTGYTITHLGDEVKIITGAPILFILTIAIVSFILWRIFLTFHKRQLDQIPLLTERLTAKDEDITRRDLEIERLSKLLKEATDTKSIASTDPTAKVYPTPSDPNLLIYPSPNGVLWRWDPERGATGPYCPNHQHVYLVLKGKYGKGEKTSDFEKDHLSFNWFVCPSDESEEFKFPEDSPLRVHHVRTQATERFRSRFQKKDVMSSWDGAVEIKYLHSEMRWKNAYGGNLQPLANELPYGATLFLQIRAKVKVAPPRLVETILLGLQGKRVEEHDWAPEVISEKELSLSFRLPNSVTYGPQQVELIIKAFGPGGGIIQRHSLPFYVTPAPSLPELERLSKSS